MALLVRSEILGLFVNNLTADGKSSRHMIENLTQLIEMQTSKKPKLFLIFFFSVFETCIKCKTFSK